MSFILTLNIQLVFEVQESEVDKSITTICNAMIKAAELPVPLEMDVGVGDNWDEAHCARTNSREIFPGND